MPSHYQELLKAILESPGEYILWCHEDVYGDVTYGKCRLRDDICWEENACWLLYKCEKGKCSYLLMADRSLRSLAYQRPRVLWCVEFAVNDLESFGYCRISDEEKACREDGICWQWFECKSPEWCSFSYATSEKGVLYEFLKEVLLEITDWYRRELVKPFLKALAYD